MKWWPDTDIEDRGSSALVISATRAISFFEHNDYGGEELTLDAADGRRVFRWCGGAPVACVRSRIGPARLRLNDGRPRRQLGRQNLVVPVGADSRAGVARPALAPSPSMRVAGSGESDLAAFDVVHWTY
ncbi:hypothetical protein OG394_04875 [Kribbella sp. NBC_01245]|uniref:hypothetical protein n=1 Tax=Kribbella sp. NBC_01245 TaxID=2903578 RepID=UPI002E2C33A1|nr:hypothetical protein [Kribbella sp. NBC_01245]